jgi:hypothetical protein
MNEKNERSRYDKSQAERTAEKANQERGGASNVPVAGEPVSAASNATRQAGTHPAPVNNPAPGDPDPIVAGRGPASPSNPTTIGGELPPEDGSGYPSNPSLDPARRHERRDDL